jgi:hypothetical protein
MNYVFNTNIRTLFNYFFIAPIMHQYKNKYILDVVFVFISLPINIFCETEKVSKFNRKFPVAVLEKVLFAVADNAIYFANIYINSVYTVHIHVHVQSRKYFMTKCTGQEVV